MHRMCGRRRKLLGPGFFAKFNHVADEAGVGVGCQIGRFIPCSVRFDNDRLSRFDEGGNAAEGLKGGIQHGDAVFAANGDEIRRAGGLPCRSGRGSRSFCGEQAAEIDQGKCRTYGKSLFKEFSPLQISVHKIGGGSGVKCASLLEEHPYPKLFLVGGKH